MIPVDIDKRTQESLFQEPLQEDGWPVTDPLRIHDHKSTGRDHWARWAAGDIVTGVHQNLGKGRGGWSGWATSVLTLGGLGLVALAGPAQAQATFCDRTPAVRGAILAKIPDITACEDVTEAHLNGITGQLRLVRRGISSLQDGDFAGLSSLQDLHILYNSLGSLPEDIFAGLSNLQDLWLDSNSLNSLDVDIFAGLSNLQRLWLFDNSLTSLDADIFDGLSSLWKLVLANNRLTSLDANIFAGLSSLQELSLGTNFLTSLNVNIFAGLTNLQELNLRNNSLGSLDANIFAGLSNLQDLWLNNISLTSLNENIFAGITNLQNLRLASNGLACLPRSVPWGRVASNALALDVSLPDCFGVSLSVTPTEVGEGYDGQSITVTAALSTGPRGRRVDTEVTVSVAGETAIEGTDFVAVEPFTITIPDGSESATGTFILTATQDAMDDGGETLRVSGTSTVSSYSAEASGETVTIQDAPGVILQPTRPSSTEGETATYTVKLNTLPDGAVTITPSSDDSGAVSVSPASLSFTTTNWNTAQTVSVTAVQDDDGNDETVSISHSVTGYATVTTAASVTVTVAEDDVPGVSVQPTTLTVVERSSGVYTLVLDAQPTTTVTITPTSDDSDALAVSPASLSFTTTNWNTAQTVTVAALQDTNDVNEMVTISHRLSGEDIRTSAPPVTVNVTDNNAPDVSVCDRTPAVQVAILRHLDFMGIENITACEDVSVFHLNSLNYILDLQGDVTNLSTLQKNDFADLSSLRILYLNEQGLRSLPEGIFAGLSSLEELDLDANNLTSLPEDAFADLSNLKTLWLLQNNNLSNLPEGIFASLSKLEVLYLDRNAISSLSEDIFAGLSNLKTLWLSRNSQLINLPEGIFAGLSNLRTLYLFGNNLNSLPAGIFSGLSNLRTLWLNENNLSSLPEGIFSGLSNLGTIYLRENNLNSLPAGIFSDLSNLGTLWLNENNLSSLPEGIFSGLSNLGAIFLHDNNLNSLPAGIFSGLSNLGTLWLNENNLRSLPEGIIDGLPNLRDLRLLRNRLFCLSRTIPWSRVGTGPDDLKIDIAWTRDCFGVSLSVTPTEVEEGNGESITVTAALIDGPRVTTGDTRLVIAMDEGTATEGTDYVVTTDTTIVITVPDSSESATGTFTLTATEDMEQEIDGETVLVRGKSIFFEPANYTPATVTIKDAPGLRVEPTGLLGTGEGGTTTYTLALNTDPGGAVTITPTSGDSGALTVSPTNVIFTTANWITAQAVTVTAVEDDDGNDETVGVSHGVSGYGRVTVGDAVTVTVTDDDEPGVRVSPVSVSPIDEGGTTAYSLALATNPVRPVTITPESGDSGAVSLSPASFVFTATNWDTAQTVTVTGAEDDDARNETVSISHRVSGYGSISIGDVVTISVTDNDEPGVSVEVARSMVDEGSAVAAYSLVLDTLPDGPVTIMAVSGDSGALSVSPARLTFTATNWNSPRTVSVTGVEDDDDRDETVSISHSVSGYGSVTTAVDVTATVTDDDERGVSVKEKSVSSIEDRAAVPYALVLDTLPDGPVTIRPVSGDSGAVSVSPASLTFSPSNWNTARTVSVTALNDDDDRDEMVTISHSVSGYGDLSIEAVVEVSVTDNDTPNVNVNPIILKSKEGETHSYMVTLITQPDGPVTITPTGDDSGALIVAPASLTFTPSNWNTARMVSVTGVQDADANDETVTISHRVSGYDTVTTAAAVAVSVSDDDTPGVSVEDVTLMVAGETGSGSYTLTLDTLPNDPVTITPVSGDSGALIVSPARLTFTAANWNTAQTVSVTGVEDADANDETVTVSHNVSGYGSVTTAAAVAVTVTDDDIAGVRVTSTNVGPAEGGMAVYALVLDTLPNTPVTIRPVSGDSGAVSVSPASLTFTPSNWDTAQMVSVTGVEDADTRNETVTISHNVSGYATVTTAAGVTATVTDEDIAEVSVTLTSVSTDEGDAATYALQLATQPNGPVTITPTSGNSGAVSVSPASLTFTPSNWDTAQTMSVTGVEDADTREETVTVSHSVSGYDSVTTAAEVTVTVMDDDTPGVRVSPPGVGTVEGDAGTYTLELRTQPNGPVTIMAVSGDNNVVSVSPASLTFTPSNWDTAQTVSVMGVEDADTTSETVTISHDVSGYGDAITAAEVTVIVTDNDAPGVHVQPISLELEEGETLTYTVGLVTLPDGAVTITPASLDSGAVSVSPARLIFTTVNWDTAQMVSVTAVQDADNNDEIVIISHGVSGYGAVNSAHTVAATVVDDDAPGVSVAPTTLPLREASSGGYTLVLDTQPDSPVTITTASGDSDAVSVSPTSLTFTPSNWDTAQMVSVTGVEDADTTSETVTISHNVSGYGAVTTATAVTVSVMDTDTAAVSVSPTSVSTSEGEAATYTLQLRTQPDGNVTITPTSGDSDAVSVSPASLTFTPSNWDTPRTVSVMGVEDTDTDNESVTIRHNVSGYTTVTTAAALTVSVADAGEDTGEDTRQSQARTEAENVLKQVVVPELVQQLSAETTEVITSRLNSIASGLPTAPLNLSLDQVVADTVAFLYGEREHLKEGSLEWRQALAGRDFAFPLSGLDLAQGEGAGGQDHLFSSLAIWGGGDYSSYGNTIKGTDVEGSGFSGTIGMDLQPTPRLVSGVALTTSRWGLDYTTTATDGSEEQGTYEMGITVLNPYVNWLATEQLSLWATFGYGRGAVEHHPDGEDDPSPQTDTGSLTSWAGGLRFAVVPGKDPLTGEGSALGLTFKVDAATSSFLGSDAQLARLAAELSHSFVMEKGLLTAALELGWSIRSVSDNDDAAGGGAELASRLNWQSSDGSVSTTVDTRVLLGGGDRREWGIGGHLRLTPSRQGGKGLSLTLQPSLGVTGTRLAELWSLSGDGDLAINSDGPGARLDARLAYGFPLGKALLTPYTEAAWEEAASTYGAGLHYRLNTSLELDLKGAHRSGTTGNTEHRFSLDLRSDL